MVVDFHTHIFPDELAPKAIEVLCGEIDNLYPPVSDGTKSGLLKNMDEWAIDISVVLPVVTKQTQTKRANEWSASVRSERLIPFGGIYPHTDDYKSDIDFAAELGLKGLKFHAEYQNFILDDKHMLKIYDYALSKGLILLHHGGFDPAFKPPFKSTPAKFLNVAKAMRGGVIIASHLGGHDQWDDVEQILAGSGIYLDTSMGFEYFSRDQFLRIVKKHGADKILFGSDAPWSNACTEIEHLKSMPLAQEDIEAILSGNAKRILKI
ncbi:MAG: amidohydrolase family protein [Oscillospiraceae bacterium]|nr:amidohydrolase family protein [Oscillospiraceae bacterium]